MYQGIDVGHVLTAGHGDGQGAPVNTKKDRRWEKPTEVPPARSRRVAEFISLARASTTNSQESRFFQSGSAH